jgi:tetratricopeptide (TPR) repeat protein
VGRQRSVEFALDKDFGFLYSALNGGQRFVKTIIFSCAFLLLVVGPSFASQSSYEKYLAKGIASVETGNFNGAIDEFAAALKERPDDGTATLYLGIAQSRAGSVGAEENLKKALSMVPQDPRANLELGIYYFNRSEFGEAKVYFENTKRIAPTSEFARIAAKYARTIKGEGLAKPFSVDITAGGQYDSNVVLNSSGEPLPQGISRKADWRAVTTLTGRYDFLNKGFAEGSVGYSLYQSLHARLSDFNITRNQLSASFGYLLSRVLGVRAGYVFEYLSVGGSGYDSAHTLAPSLLVHEGNDFSLQIDYRYTKSNYMDSDLFSGNSERTGSNNFIGVIQTVPLGKSMSFAAGYAHDEERTRQAFWDYHGDRIKADFQTLLPMNVRAAVDGEYYSKRYLGPSPLTGDARRDEVFTTSVTLAKPITRNCDVSIGQLFTKNKSNITAFDYSRAITSIFFDVRF